MYIVLYRWRIRAGKEEQFVTAWAEVTAYYRRHFDSLGSRLHRGGDGLFYAYAQWQSAADRQAAFAGLPDLEIRTRMKEAVEETFPEVELEMLSDYLIWPEAT